jgi:hypothetical protein
MRGKAAPIALALLLAAIALASCGESGPKRAVDARTEVLRFFAVDAPVVAELRPNPTASIAALNRAGGGVPTWSRLRDLVLGPLHAAGLGRAELARLVKPKEEIEGVAASALALGAPTAASLATQRPLLVIATDQTELLSRLLRRAAQRGRLDAAGRLDEAVLYRSPAAAFAVRDGVLVSAPHLADVRAAIERRDGDRDQQLDEDVVESLFNSLDTQGPLLVYANMASLRDADPGLATLADREQWIDSAGQAAASVRAAAGSLQVEVVVKMAEDLEPADQPFGTAPARFSLSSPELPSLIPRRTDPLREALSGLLPLTGEGTASEDEVRIRATISP